MDATDTSLGSRSGTHSILGFKTMAGFWMALKQEDVVAVQPIERVFPCHWTDRWIEGMVIRQRTVLPLIRVETYLAMFAPKLHDELVRNSEQGTSSGSQTDRSADDTTVASAVVLRKGLLALALRCDAVKLISLRQEAGEPEEEVGEINYRRYHLGPDEWIIRVEVADFLSRMTWVEEESFEDSSGSGGAGSSQPMDGSAGSLEAAPSEAEAQQQSPMLLVHSSNRTLLIDSKDVSHMVWEYVVTLPPPVMPRWVRKLVGVGDHAVVPVIDFRETSLLLGWEDPAEGEGLENPTDQNSLQKSIVMITYDNKVIGMEADRCHLVRSYEEVQVDDARFGMVEGTRHPIFHTRQLFDMVSEGYELPRPLSAVAPPQSQIYILMNIGHSLCAISIRDALRVADGNQVKPYEGKKGEGKKGADFGEQFGGRLCGILPGAQNVLVPVFDVSRSICPQAGAADWEQGSEAQEGSDAIVVIGQSYDRAFGIVATEIRGLIRVLDEDVFPIRSTSPLMMGMLKVDDVTRAFILGT